MPISIPRDIRKLLAFGTGIGIEVGTTDLEVVAARVRPPGVRVPGHMVIRNFATRPAAEWGAEYGSFLKSLGMSHLSATVLLPRREVIVRQVSLPGVSAKEMGSALALQLDTLHPYGDDEVVWGWSLAAPGTALVGVVRQGVIDRYVQLFNEAGVAVCSFTFSAAAIHAAVRLNAQAMDAGFVALGRSSTGGMEVYGESASKPVFSAEFGLPPQRAAVLALSELRLAPDTAPLRLEDVLPKPTVNPVENDISRNAMPYATALAGACPRLAPSANVLPRELRRFNSRVVFIPTVVLASLLVLLVAAIAVVTQYAERRYLRDLHAEIDRLVPRQTRAENLDKALAATRARTHLLDEIRKRTHADMDVLSDLTRLIEAPGWTNTIDLTREGIRLNGEAPQATSLVKILDSSPLFKNSRLEVTQGQVFQIRTDRQVTQ